MKNKNSDHQRRKRSQIEKEIVIEERRVLADLSLLEKDVREKENRVEELNRELRKANLQNFVRETSGSKVKLTLI